MRKPAGISKKSSFVSVGGFAAAALLVLSASCTSCIPTGDEQPPAPRCRMEYVQVPAQRGSETLGSGDPQCNDQGTIDAYYALCNRLVTQFENTCQGGCRHYNKRAIQDPDNPNVHGEACNRFPVTDAASALYDPARHCEQAAHSVTITCEVSATCRCDP